MLSHLNSLKKRILLLTEAALDRIQESDGFNLLKERFQALPPRRQKLVKYLAFSLILVPAAGLPLSFFYSSSKYLRDFREKDSLSRALLRAGAGRAFQPHQKSAAEVKKLLSSLTQRYAEEEGLKIKDLGPLSESESFEGGENGGSGGGRGAGGKRGGQSNSGAGGLAAHQMELSVPRLNIKQAASLGEKISRFKSLKIRRLKLKESLSHENHYDTEFSVVFFPPAALRAVKGTARPPSPSPAEAAVSAEKPSGKKDKRPQTAAPSAGKKGDRR